MALDILTSVAAADVAKNGTVDFAYPAGTDADTFVAGDEYLAIPTHQSVLKVGAGRFSVLYDSTEITVTYLGETTIPSGTSLSLQVNRTPDTFSKLVGKVEGLSGSNLQEILEDVADKVAA